MKSWRRIAVLGLRPLSLALGAALLASTAGASVASGSSPTPIGANASGGSNAQDTGAGSGSGQVSNGNSGGKTSNGNGGASGNSNGNGNGYGSVDASAGSSSGNGGGNGTGTVTNGVPLGASGDSGQDNAGRGSASGHTDTSEDSGLTGPVLANGVVSPSGTPVILSTPVAGASVLPIGQAAGWHITATGPVSITAAVSTTAGGTVVGGNVAVTIPPAALAAVAPSNKAISVAVHAIPRGLPVPGGPARYSPNGTVADVAISDSTGKAVTTFAAPISITLKYNAADLAMAGGSPTGLTAAYVIDAHSPAIENPLHFPIGTFVFFPPGSVTNDRGSGLLQVQTRALGSVVAVITNPVGYVQTLKPRTRLYSSFDPATSQDFGADQQFHFLRVVEPQIGSRFLVIDPETGNYAYVQASDVGPSGEPPGRPSAAVVRALLRDGLSGIWNAGGGTP